MLVVLLFMGYTVILHIIKYAPNIVFLLKKKANFLLNQRYQDFIISSEALYSQNEYY